MKTKTLTTRKRTRYVRVEIVDEDQNEKVKRKRTRYVRVERVDEDQKEKVKRKRTR